jgi:hypothetical protein
MSIMRSDDSEDILKMADTTPLPANAVSFKSHSLVVAGEHRRILRHSFAMRAGAALMIPVGIGVIYAGRIGFPPLHPIGLISSGMGLFFLVIGTAVVVLGPSVVFDRDAGTVRIRRTVWSATTRHLSDILAVQLISGGWHKTPRGLGQYLSYQLNLVLNDRDEPRVNLTNHSDGDATRDVASQLAKFLKVPLCDEVSKRKSSSSSPRLRKPRSIRGQ